jgi:hypothetical protein
MSTIGSSQLSQSQLNEVRNIVSSQSASRVIGPDTTERLSPTGKSLLPEGGLSAAAGAGALALGPASLDGINWDALAADMATTDTMSISISDIMVLLVGTMAEMRKGQREAWMAEAQNALSMGLNAADRMRESAAAKLACDCVSNGVSIMTAAVSIGTQGASMAKEFAVSKAVNSQVDAAMQAQQKAMQAAQAQATNVVGKGLSEQTVGISSNQLDNLKLNNSSQLTSSVKLGGDQPLGQEASKLGAAPEEIYDHLEPKVPTTSETGSANPSSQTGNDPKTWDANQAKVGDKQMELRMWATQEKARLMRPFNAKVEIITKGFEIAGSFGKVGASVGEYYSGIKQAEAQEARARGDFATNIAQVELDFANELRDSMKGALDAMKSVEASRHQAMQGIYNI